MKTAKLAGPDSRGPYSVKPVSPIARARLAAGLKKVEAAKLCRVSLRTYERAEAGDVVSWPTKCHVERVLGIRF